MLYFGDTFKNEMANELEHNEDCMDTLYVLTHKQWMDCYGANVVQVMTHFATIVLGKPINNIEIKQDYERQNVLTRIAEQALSDGHVFTEFNRMLKRNGVSAILLNEPTEFIF